MSYHFRNVVFEGGGVKVRSVAGAVRTLLNAQQSQHLHSGDWHRTVYIDYPGVGTTDFDLSDARKETPVESGRQHTLAYFEWFDEADDAWNAPA